MNTPITDQVEQKAIRCMNHSGALKILIPKCRELECENERLRAAGKSLLFGYRQIVKQTPKQEARSCAGPMADILSNTQDEKSQP
jgi:hypothetical protein